MTQIEEYPPSMEGVLSQKPEVKLQSLLAIKDDIIGHALRKSAYINQQLVKHLLEMLQNPTTPPEIRIEATTVLGSLCHGMLPPIFSR